MFFTGSTIFGNADKPNEDWMAASSDLVVVLDGATVRTDTGCRHGVDWFTRKLGAGIIAGAASKSQSLAGALAEAIQNVAALHPDCDLAHPGTPSAAAGLVRVEGDFVRYAVLGDVTLVVETADDLLVVSDERVSKTAAAERAEADKYSIGSSEKQAAMVQMKHAELAARNVEGGYWIASTDPAVVDHAVTGEIPVSQVRRMAVLTDGAARAVTMFGLYSWRSLLDALEQAGPDKLVRQVREAEAADPVGERHPRNKTSDDASVVFAAASQHSEAPGSPRRTRSKGFEPNRQLARDLLTSFQNAPGLMGENQQWRKRKASRA